VDLSFLKNKVWQVDGITVTVGAIVLIVLIGLLAMRAFKK